MSVPDPLPIGLALQGGGSHGAFGWGALERLLEEPRLAIKAVSGTSAGAVNGFVLGLGWLDGGRAGAAAALAQFWEAVAAAQERLTLGLFDRTRFGLPPGDPGLDDNPLYLFADLVGRLLSPYELGLPDTHPLEHVFRQEPRLAALDRLDVTALVAAGGPRIWVTATDVTTGEAMLFGGDLLTRRQVLASACLPTLTRAVREGGRIYWDGGYSANPALKPLMRAEDVADLLIVQVNPRDRAAEPDTARAIINRINEVSFNSSLLWQTRGIERLNDIAVAIEALLDGLAEEPAIDAAVRRRVLERTRATLARHAALRRDLADRIGCPPLNLLLPRRLLAALADLAPDRAADVVMAPLRQMAVHMIDADAPGDRGIERFGASSKLNASRWFIEELREFGRARAAAWLRDTLPLILETRATGEVLSTFWHGGDRTAPPRRANPRLSER
jgi:NTE family protein